jgi:hypothetical protein
MLTSKQRNALAALVSGATRLDAAQAANVSAATIYRWLNDAAFNDELKTQSRAMVDNAAMVASATMRDSIDVLKDVMADPTASHFERLRAVDLLLRYAIKLREHTTLQDDLDVVKRYLENENNS